MNQQEIFNKIREELANLEHEQWIHWTNYFLYNYSTDNVIRWSKQALTIYPQLSEEEKQSDREWADKVIKIFKDAERQEALKKIKSCENSILYDPDWICKNGDDIRYKCLACQRDIERFGIEEKELG